MKFVDKADDKGGGWDHRRELPVIHYHGTMVTYPYPFLVEMTKCFSCMILYMYMNWFTWIIFIHDHMCYTKNGGNENSPDYLNAMVNYHYHSEKE